MQQLATQRTAESGGFCAFERITRPDYVHYVYCASQNACIFCRDGVSVVGDPARGLRARLYCLVGKTWAEGPAGQRERVHRAVPGLESLLWRQKAGYIISTYVLCCKHSVHCDKNAQSVFLLSVGRAARPRSPQIRGGAW